MSPNHSIHQVLPARVVAVVGNPRPGSRTAALATALARAIAGLGEALDIEVLDLAELAETLGSPLGADSAQRWAEPLAQVHAARVLVVATPVYKGSYTGLLKSFLDHVAGGALHGIIAVPVTSVGNPGHALAADLHLRPLLIELGAATPASSLVVIGPALDDPTTEIKVWLELNQPIMEALLGG
jgi:FMN reductase